jgi:hypothetical protein
MDVSTTQLGTTVSSAGPSSTVTQPRTCGIQLCAAVRLGLGQGQGREVEPNLGTGKSDCCTGCKEFGW